MAYGDHDGGVILGISSENSERTEKCRWRDKPGRSPAIQISAYYDGIERIRRRRRRCMR